MIFVAVVTGLVGLAVRLAIGRRGPAPAPEPDRPVAADREPSADAAQILRQTLSQLEIGAMIAPDDGATLFRNDAASPFVGTQEGLVVDDRLNVVMADARSGASISRVIEIHGPPKVWIELSANGYAHRACGVISSPISRTNSRHQWATWSTTPAVAARAGPGSGSRSRASSS